MNGAESGGGKDPGRLEYTTKGPIYNLKRDLRKRPVKIKKDPQKRNLGKSMLQLKDQYQTHHMHIEYTTNGPIYNLKRDLRKRP